MAYLYRHIRLDTEEVFYIGISNDKNYKRAYNRIQRSKFWKYIISKTDYMVEILFDDLTIEEVNEKEKEFIKLYGFKHNDTGSLVNFTLGGEGCKGYNHTAETKLIISKKKKGIKKDNNFKKKMSEIASKRIMTEQTKQKISDSGKLRKHSDITKEKMSKSRTKNKISVFDLTHNLLYTYDSVKMAIKELTKMGHNVCHPKIYSVCNGKQKTHASFIFEYSLQ